MYVCMYVCMYVWLFVCMYTCMYACVYACVHIHVHAFISFSIYLYIGAYIEKYTHMHTHTQIHHICTYIYKERERERETERDMERDRERKNRVQRDRRKEHENTRTVKGFSAMRLRSLNGSSYKLHQLSSQRRSAVSNYHSLAALADIPNHCWFLPSKLGVCESQGPMPCYGPRFQGTEFVRTGQEGPQIHRILHPKPGGLKMAKRSSCLDTLGPETSIIHQTIHPLIDCHLSISICIYLYIYMHMHIYIYTYTHTLALHSWSPI